MAVTLVVGGQWGDEGKAKIIDFLAENADIVARYQGGANAGHTVVVGNDRFAFHLVPSGILYPHATCILGGGMVIDPTALTNEIDGIAEKGIDVEGRIFISEQAHIVLPYHIAMDCGSEERLGDSSIGTTRKGISPAYIDKIGRRGIRMGDLLRPRADLERLLDTSIKENNRQLRAQGNKTIPVKATIQTFLQIKKKIGPMITDTRLLLWSALDKKKKILCEGAQGSLLDIDHGTYPFVTSSSASAGGAVSGTGLPPSAFTRIIGIFKAYCTRVGNGPFPSEDGGKAGNTLRDIGNEYGTTTGRPRRCGWFDAVAARTVVRLNGLTEIALTKLDVLDDFDQIKVCTQYRVGKDRLDYFPVNTRTLAMCKPEYDVIEGWNKKSFVPGKDKLPGKAASYVKYLERLVGCRIRLVSLGPERSAMIDRG